MTSSRVVIASSLGLAQITAVRAAHYGHDPVTAIGRRKDRIWRRLKRETWGPAWESAALLEELTG